MFLESAMAAVVWVCIRGIPVAKGHAKYEKACNIKSVNKLMIPRSQLEGRVSMEVCGMPHAMQRRIQIQ